jgi:hypothetical protein
MSTSDRAGSRWGRAVRAGALMLAFGGGAGCSAYSTLKSISPPVDCSVADAYEFKAIDTFETPGMAAPLWTSADCSGGAMMAVAEVALPNGGQCGSTAALEITASHNNQWGSLAGYNNFGPRDGSAYQGISFWARAAAGTSESFTILLDDPNTAQDTGVSPPIGNCTTYPSVDAGCGMAAGGGTFIDPSTGAVLGSGTSTNPPLPDACGNSYAALVTVTNDWKLYTLPYGKFQQGPTPNMVGGPNVKLTQTGYASGTTLMPSQLLNLTLRMQKAVEMDLWIDNLSFYRPKGWVPLDGGADGH